MGESDVNRLIVMMENVCDRLARIEENQKHMSDSVKNERESRLACLLDCNRRINSLEMSRAHLVGWIIGAAAGGGTAGGLIASLIRSAT
jgi:hypothetical protein